MNNGGTIKVSHNSGKVNTKAVKGARAGIKLYRKGFAV
jgi:hypothetical protein